MHSLSKFYEFCAAFKRYMNFKRRFFVAQILPLLVKEQPILDITIIKMLVENTE